MNKPTEGRVREILSQFVESIIPKGEWKHIKMNDDWEKNNKNNFKNKVGKFFRDGIYTVFEVKGMQEKLHIQSTSVKQTDDKLVITGLGGMKYEFARVQ